MIRLARTLLYADEAAEDVVQDVFVRLMDADILPAEDKTRSYLLTAVRNGCINRIRQKRLSEQVKSLYSIEAETDMLYNEELTEKLESRYIYSPSTI
jgi:RNA polymerase sigma factor (sigma-70 family)